jgi:hypothetical protein
MRFIRWGAGTSADFPWSVTDTILHAERPSKPQLAPDLPFDEVLGTLQSVCRPPVRVADEAELHA